MALRRDTLPNPVVSPKQRASGYTCNRYRCALLASKVAIKNLVDGYDATFANL
jgi:hypothetical protein